MTTSRIPFDPATPQQFVITLSGKDYVVQALYLDVDEGGWVLNLSDANTNQPILNGVPLVTGSNLLAQYGYLDFGGALVVQTDHDPDAVPTFENLGGTSNLYWLVTT